MPFTGVWFFIATLILLYSSPSLAVSYLRVNQQGVIYYYFNNRGPANPDCLQTRPSEENSPALRKVVASQGPLPRLNLPLASILVPKQLSTNSRFDANSPSSRLGQLAPDASEPSPAVNASDFQENPAAARRGIMRLLTKLNFFDAPVLAPAEDQDFCLDNNNFLVPDVWSRVPKYFQATSQKSNLFAAPEVTLPPSMMLPLPKYACQPRLWGRVASGGSLKPDRSQYYCFPVASCFTFRDTWGDPRPGGRMHRATDIFAPEGTELYAITSGVIQSLSTSSTGGIMLMLAGHDGHGYGYMHLMGYADGTVVGKAVKAGELVGYVGRTGTHDSPAHLHIQVYPDLQFSHETLVNPYDFLVQLCRGIGVTDLNQPKVARQPVPDQLKIARPADSMLKSRKNKIKWIQVYQRPWPKGLGEHTLKLDFKSSPVLVIRNN
jgi:murein DD-endopeptidase MepM/ murein hydrolase activator NlpD